MYYLCVMKTYYVRSLFPIPVDEISFMIHAFGYTVRVSGRRTEEL
jgi:hypothetical protein